jgi:hypothetical protein
MSTNGSPLVDSSTVPVTLAAAPGALGLTIQCYPDPRGAPHAGAAVQSTLVLAVVNLQSMLSMALQRIAVLEVAMAEHAREDARDFVIPCATGPRPFPLDRPRDEDRARVALAAVDTHAAQIQLNEQAPATGSALDAIGPS